MESLNNKKIASIKEAIIKTIAFFDLFDYPLTEFEIWQYLAVKHDFCDITKVLAGKNFLEVVEEKDGFYFLRGRQEIIKTKMARYNYADKKFKKAMLVSRFFKIIPWIGMIAVGNLIGSHNLKKQGDIDLFIIAKKGRVWMTRFFCAGFAQLFGLRPTEKNMENKICLSFFISENVMDLQGLMSGTSDIYFIYWLAGLVPIYNKDDIYNKFIKANGWIKNYLPNWQPAKVSLRRDSGKGFSSFYKDLIDLLIGGAEKTVKKIQLKKMPKKLTDSMNKDTRVVVNDSILKLYTNDRREEYRKMWEKSLLDIKLKNWILQ